MSEDELRERIVVSMFEAGKELSRQYAKYDGDLDWIDWLKETLPKVPGFYDKLDALTQRISLESRIDELERGGLPFKRDTDRLAELKAQLTNLDTHPYSQSTVQDYTTGTHTAHSNQGKQDLDNSNKGKATK